MSTHDCTGVLLKWNEYMRNEEILDRSERVVRYKPVFSVPEYICWTCFVNRLRLYKKDENRKRALLNELARGKKDV